MNDLKLSYLGHQREIVAMMSMAFRIPQYAESAFYPQDDSPVNEVHFDAAPWDRLTSQCLNIADEISELEAGMEIDATVHIRDALCDIRVFTLQACYLISYQPDFNPEHFVYSKAAVAVFLDHLPAVPALRAAYYFLMEKIKRHEIYSVKTALQLVLYISERSAAKLGIPSAQLDIDMQAVIDGVMTRFIKDEDDLFATCLKHKEKGVTEVYFEGEFPTRIMKSGVDQPDAPKGKFLKSASYKEPVFAPFALDYSESVINVTMDAYE